MAISICSATLNAHDEFIALHDFVFSALDKVTYVSKREFSTQHHEQSMKAVSQLNTVNENIIS